MTDLFPHLFGNILHGIMLRLFRQMFLTQRECHETQSCFAFRSKEELCPLTQRDT